MDNSARGDPAKAPTLVWDRCSRGEWDGLLARAGRSPIEQSWGYGAGLRRTRTRRGVIEDDKRPIAIVQVFERPLLFSLRLAQIVRGPLWLIETPDPRVLALIKSEFRLRSGALLVWMPELPAGRESIDMMRATGLRRMTTGYSSAWIDLGRTEDELRGALHGKWRNALRVAERRGLEVAITDDDDALDWLLARYEAHRKRRRYSGPSQEFVRAMTRAGSPFTVLRASMASAPVAGVLFVHHGAAATYYVGWTDAAGRRLNAHNLLLWRGMLALKAAGLSWLDIGGINAAAPGVARFKMGAGGAFFTLTGTYI